MKLLEEHFDCWFLTGSQRYSGGYLILIVANGTRLYAGCFGENVLKEEILMNQRGVPFTEGEIGYVKN